MESKEFDILVKQIENLSIEVKELRKEIKTSLTELYDSRNKHSERLAIMEEKQKEVIKDNNNLGNKIREHEKDHKDNIDPKLNKVTWQMVLIWSGFGLAITTAIGLIIKIIVG